MTPVNWRRAYMRLLAQYLNETIKTGLDLLDASGKIDHRAFLKETGHVDTDKEYLREDEITVQVELADTFVNVDEIVTVLEKVQDTLNKTVSSVAISEGRLRATFEGEDKTNWRDGFMDLVTLYLSVTTHTVPRITDASKMEYYDTQTDDPIVIRVPIGKERVDMGVVYEIADTIREVLEKPLKSVGVLGSELELDFHGEGGTTE